MEVEDQAVQHLASSGPEGREGHRRGHGGRSGPHRLEGNDPEIRVVDEEVEEP